MSVLMSWAEGLVERYAEFAAVGGVSFAVPLGVLGPDAGEPTTVPIVTTPPGEPTTRLDPTNRKRAAA